MKKCQRLFLCSQYVGEIRLKNRMRMRTTFAEFEEILIADWQYDELEIPLYLPIQHLTNGLPSVTMSMWRSILHRR